MVGGKNVDLTLLAIDVPSNAPAQVLQPSSLALNTATTTILPITNPYLNGPKGPMQITQAGYGLTSTLANVNIAGQGPTNLYKVNPNTYGGYAAAPNTLSAINVPNAGPDGYSFNGIKGTLTFTTDMTGTVTTGTSYVNSGDSGGPTFEADATGTVGLIGVHSSSTNTKFTGDASSYDEPGSDFWTDVSLSSYVNTYTIPSGTVQNGINPDTFNNIPFATINVPEPAMMLLPLLLPLHARRKRRPTATLMTHT